MHFTRTVSMLAVSIIDMRQTNIKKLLICNVKSNKAVVLQFALILFLPIEYRRVIILEQKQSISFTTSKLRSGYNPQHLNV